MIKYCRLASLFINRLHSFDIPPDKVEDVDEEDEGECDA